MPKNLYHTFQNPRKSTPLFKCNIILKSLTFGLTFEFTKMYDIEMSILMALFVRKGPRGRREFTAAMIAQV